MNFLVQPAKLKFPFIKVEYRRSRIEMDAPVLPYWEKSKENLLVAEEAKRTGSYNAAASRYYYALVLAGLALLERENIFYEWTNHETFINDTGYLLASKHFGERADIVDALEKALKFRIRADYEPFPVIRRHLDIAITACSPVLEALEIELK